MNLSKRLLCLLLCLCMALVMLPGVVTAEKILQEPVQTRNLNAHNYASNRWATPTESYLLANDDGTVTRVEPSGSRVAVEVYNEELEFVSGSTVDMELSKFGGFYSGSDSYFLIFGKDNIAQDDTAEVIRVVRYDKNWQRIGSVGLFGGNTMRPFDIGSLRCAEYQGYLYIRTAHEMYMSSDGFSHQANLTMNVRLSDMTITDAFYDVMNVDYGYVSHSFNQFIQIDDGKIYAVDHGDAYPRGVVLMRYKLPAGQDVFLDNYALFNTDYVNVLEAPGQIGDNNTGLAVGGFEISDTHCLIAGNSIAMVDNYSFFGQRNIFVSATAKENFPNGETKLNYLTNYAEGAGVSVSVPHLTEINDDRYALVWTETAEDASTLRWAFLDGQGNLIGSVYSGEGVLSDCQPVVSGNRLVWYVTDYTQPTFLVIDLDHPETVTHSHAYGYVYESSPNGYGTGLIVGYCIVCGEEGDRVVMPAIVGSDEYSLDEIATEPTCTQKGYGYYTWDKAPQYGLYHRSYWAEVAPLGHDYQGVVTEPTCTKDGYTTYSCSRCDKSYRDDYVPAAHRYVDGQCSLCGVKDPNAASLSGTLTSFLTGSVTVSATPEGAAQPAATVTLSENTAEYVFKNLSAGTYTLTVSKDGHVTRTYTVKLKAGENRQDLKIHPLGDVNGDGKVNMGDVSKAFAHVRRKALITDEYSLLCADANKDGKLNLGDIARIFAHVRGSSLLF